MSIKLAKDTNTDSFYEVFSIGTTLALASSRRYLSGEPQLLVLLSAAQHTTKLVHGWRETGQKAAGSGRGSVTLLAVRPLIYEFRAQQLATATRTSCRALFCQSWPGIGLFRALTWSSLCGATSHTDRRSAQGAASSWCCLPVPSEII